MNDAQPTHQPTPTANPPTCGRLALEREIDALWRETRNPKLTLFGARRIYGRLAELRAELETLNLEKQDNGN